MTSKVKLGLAAVIGSVILGLPGAANASLIGDSVEGSFTASFDIDAQFTSPAIVGAGVEFTGTMSSDFFEQTWNIEVDIDGSGFTVGLSELDNGGDGSSGANFDIITISLSDLDWVGMPGFIVNVTNSDYSCTSDGDSCAVFGGGPSISSLIFGDHTISVSFDAIRDGELYTFSIEADHVPEPASLALFGFGLLGLGAMRRRQRAV